MTSQNETGEETGTFKLSTLDYLLNPLRKEFVFGKHTIHIPPITI